MTDGIFELLKQSLSGVTEFKSRIGPNHDQFQQSLVPIENFEVTTALLILRYDF